jgi:propionyl-CoA synthetase
LRALILSTFCTPLGPQVNPKVSLETAEALASDSTIVFDVHQGSVHFAASDIGWVVGHSFIVYGPLIRGAKAIFFEGKPVVPDAGVMWRVCQ